MSALLRPVAATLLLLATITPARAQAPSASFLATTTAYCEHGIGRAGVPVGYGTVAVDPRVIPLWSQLTIDGVEGVFTALDTGSGVRGEWVDIWMGSCGEAIQWGRQLRVVTILEP